MQKLSQCLGLATPIDIKQVVKLNSEAERSKPEKLEPALRVDASETSQFGVRFIKFQRRWLCALGEMFEQTGLRSWGEVAKVGWMPGPLDCPDETHLPQNYA